MKQFSEVINSACPKCGWFPGGSEAAWAGEYKIASIKRWRGPLDGPDTPIPEHILLTCIKCGYTKAVHPMDREGDE